MPITDEYHRRLREGVINSKLQTGRKLDPSELEYLKSHRLTDDKQRQKEKSLA